MRVRSIAMIDVETSSLDVEDSEIIYVHATIMPVNGRISTFSEYAKPNKPLDKSVEKLTEITNEMLIDKRPSNEVKSDFVELIRDSIIIGSNRIFLEQSLGIKLTNYIDAREIMKIELVSSHGEELRELKEKLDSDKILTIDVQKKLAVPYPEASMITEVLNAMGV